MVSFDRKSLLQHEEEMWSLQVYFSGLRRLLQLLLHPQPGFSLSLSDELKRSVYVYNAGPQYFPMFNFSPAVTKADTPSRLASLTDIGEYPDLEFMSFFLNRFAKIWNPFVRNRSNAAKSSIAILLLAGTIPCQAQVSTKELAQDDPYKASTKELLQDDPYKLYFQTSVATRHFHPDPAHNNHQKLLNLEWNYKDDYLVGAALFQNSFYQPCQLIYWGAKFHPVESAPGMYFKLIGGLLHGYKDGHLDSIPLDHMTYKGVGIAPAILPSVGYCRGQFCSELVVFGVAGAMLTAGVKF
jgi:hypothetical protein